MKLLKKIFVVFILFAIQSCSESEHQSTPIVPLANNFTYPIQIGNEWTIHSSTNFINIRPDSISYLLINHQTNDKLMVTKDTLLNSINCYEINDEREDHSFTRAYYSNTDSGFIKYAYSNSAGNVLPKNNLQYGFIFNGKNYRSVYELLDSYSITERVLKQFVDTLHFYTTPRMIYAYPLEPGKEWNLTSEFIKIDKEVIGKEIIYTAAGGFECLKIIWKYDINYDGVTDDNIVCYEYINTKGLIKLEINLKDVLITTDQSPEGIGLADVTAERILMAINF